MKVKVISILLIVSILIFNTSTVFAAGKIDTKSYDPGVITKSSYDVAFDKIGKIVNMLTVLGIIIAVIVTIIIGIKYMFASVEEKADYKKTLIPLGVGIVLLVTTPTLVSIIYSIVSEIKIV